VKLARVIGTVVASRKTEGLEGIKLLVVQPLTRTGVPRGQTAVAADATAQAAAGELVFVVASREAAQALPEPFVPVDLAITGIVDQIDAPAELPPAGVRWPGAAAAPRGGPPESPPAGRGRRRKNAPTRDSKGR